jgi:hypothetical protein
MARIKCRGCGAVQDVEDALPGQLSACAACGRLLRLPPAPDTSIREDRPGSEPRPLVLSPYGERVPDIAREPPPAEQEPPRRSKPRRKRRAASLGERWRYYLGAVDTFGWVLVGLGAFWLAGLIGALLSPGLGRLLLLAGTALVAVGNVWIGFVAYRDGQVYGMLCFCTCLFVYVYVLMNPDETWRPGALTGLGFVFVVSGLVASHLAGAPVPTP